MNFRLGPGRNNRSKLNRRAFLRGAGGVALGLPFLESMPSRSAWAQSTNPVFSMFIVQSCGVVANSFWPTETGPLSSSTMTGTASAGLIDYASQTLFVGGIRFPANNSGCGHAQGLCMVLTGAGHNGGGGNTAQSTAESVDTTIANAVNPGGVEPLAMYAGLKGGYINERISFRAAGQVRNAEGNPYEIYKDLIGLAGSGGSSAPMEPVDPADTVAVVDEMAVRKTSVNDLVREELTRLKAQSVMSQMDKERLDRHLDGIRDIETDMASMGLVTISGCDSSALNEAEFQAVDGKARQNGLQETLAILHMQLAAFAFACNANRTATLQVGDGTDATVYDVPSNSRRWGMHHISHRVQSDAASGNDQTAAAAHAEIDALRIQNFKTGLDAFASYSTNTGTLLDESVVVWTNHINDGPSHSFNNVPYIIAGSGGGYFKQGEYVSLGGGGGGGGFGGGGGGVTNDLLLNSIKTACGAGGGEGIPEILAS